MMIDWLNLHREYLNAGEMEIIADLLCRIEARTVVEIGCRDGRTARVLLHNVPSLQRYVGVDVPMNYMPSLPCQRGEMVSNPGHLAAADPRFELIIREHGSFELMPLDLPACDAMFIDGDHCEAAVINDSELAAAVVRLGGKIIWHDAGNAAVEVDSALRRLDWPIDRIPGTWLAVRTM